MQKKVSNKPIWCEHCGAEIMPKAVKACLRKTCKTKDLLLERDKVAS